MQNSAITKLPDEVLVNIFTRLRGRQRYNNRDLLNLALTCRPFVPAAREVLLVAPSFHLFRVAGLVRNYLQYPQLADAVRELEITALHKDQPDRELMTRYGQETAPGAYPARGSTIWSANPLEHSRKPSSYPAPTLDPLKLDARFKKACIEVIESHSLSAQKRKAWIQDLEVGCMRAFLGLLLVLLPKIKVLLLGANYLRHYPILAGLVGYSSLVGWSEFSHSAATTPAEWENSYLVDVFNVLAPKLKEFELPAIWFRHFMAPWPQLLPGLSHLSALQTLTISGPILTSIVQRDNYNGVEGQQADLVVFPASVRHLRIVDASVAVALWVIEHGERQQNNIKDRMPALAKITIYYYRALDDNSFSCDDNHDNNSLLPRFRRIERSTGIKIETWEPMHILPVSCVHGQPWKYHWMELLEIETKRIEQQRENLRERAEALAREKGELLRNVIDISYQPGKLRPYTTTAQYIDNEWAHNDVIEYYHCITVTKEEDLEWSRGFTHVTF
ncbi:hypothetical protein BDV95DRAFT_581954 [Massariosphaeria phaeospora]|uniref:F-box domain-containing protein n=1 Tax=Massariosphaeria phaeospora TaxID=100035 RepID=A0A7C8I0F4_9PLEO|nr:hypothetical protein BDV95DRAFT_581954 [Massariosphaeria phaeospora]